MGFDNLHFNQILNAAITPLVLISSVGLLLLSLVNRYHHITDRIRQLLGSACSDEKIAEKREQQVQEMYRRCRILKKSMELIVISISCSAFIILLSIMQLVLKVNLEVMRTVLLVSGMLALVVSIILFLTDIRLSMRSLEIEIGLKKKF